MPVLPPPVRMLINNARFTAVDLVALRRAIEARQVTVTEARAIASRYADTLEPGVGSWLRALLQSLNTSTAVELPIANLSQETALLNGQIILPDSGRRHAAVRSIQRALNALASRLQRPSYLLSQYGADGDYGGETTQAVRNFQQDYGLPVTGKVDLTTAKAIDQALQSTHVPGILSATPQDLVAAAIDLCTDPVSLNYGVPQPWVNLDPSHNVPAERPFTYLVNRWKCNLFGGNVLRKGGYEPPYYGNQGKGEYPNANQWYKWSDKYATQFGNRVHFQLIDEVPVVQLSEDQRQVAITNFLSKVQPGDFVMADHVGDAIADGGHTRVATATQVSIDGTLSFAQARYDKAMVEQEGVADLLWEETIWLLRPNRKM